MKRINYRLIALHSLLITLLFAGCATQPKERSGADDRRIWVETMLKISDPVLRHTAAGTLKANMPYESTDKKEERRDFSYLEALGRTLCGIAPWLESDEDDGGLKVEYRLLARQALSNAVNPENPDYMTFDHGTQPLVDAAYLSQGLLRAPIQLWEKLDA